MTLKQEKILHYFLMGVMVALVVLAVGFVYISMRGNSTHVVQPVVDQDVGAGQARLLPDFIVDKVPSDELESLKP